MMHQKARLVLSLAVLGCVPTLGFAQGPEKQISPFVDPETVAVAHIDVGEIDSGAIVNVLGQLLDLPKPMKAKIQKQIQNYQKILLQAGVRDVYAVSSFSGVFRSPGYLVIPLQQERDAMLLRTLFGVMPRVKTAVIRKALVVAADEATLARVKAIQPAPNKNLRAAFAKAKGAAAKVVLLLPKNLRRSLDEVVGTLPQEWGNMPLTPLTKDFRAATISINLKPKFELNVDVEAKNAEAAKRLHKVLSKIITEFVQMKGFRMAMPGLDDLVSKVKSKIVRNSIVLKVDEKAIIAVVAPAIQKMRAAASRSVAQNNLKQLGLAMHNYHDTHRKFPPQATYDKQGRPLLSWRVHLLPYIEQNELYKQFKLDEPWDSPHNKKLIAKMPMTFRSPNSNAGPGKTTYLVPLGKRTIFGVKGGCRIRDITDGTSNTILIVEADDKFAVPWTKPEDLKYDPKNPKAAFQNQKRGFNAAFADGSVRFISQAIDAKVLRALFTRNGEEVVSD